MMCGTHRVVTSQCVSEGQKKADPCLGLAHVGPPRRAAPTSGLVGAALRGGPALRSNPVERDGIRHGPLITALRGKRLTTRHQVCHTETLRSRRWRHNLG